MVSYPRHDFMVGKIESGHIAAYGAVGQIKGMVFNFGRPLVVKFVFHEAGMCGDHIAHPGHHIDAEIFGRVHLFIQDDEGRADAHIGLQPAERHFLVRQKAVALQGKETASVPATSKGEFRYLYLELSPEEGRKGSPRPQRLRHGAPRYLPAQLLGGDRALTVTRDGGTITVAIPPDVPGGSVRVVKLSPKP